MAWDHRLVLALGLVPRFDSAKSPIFTNINNPKSMQFKQIKLALFKALNCWLRAMASPEDKMNLRRQEQGRPLIIYW